MKNSIIYYLYQYITLVSYKNHLANNGNNGNDDLFDWDDNMSMLSDDSGFYQFIS